MKIAILSRKKSLYSTRRLVEAGTGLLASGCPGEMPRGRFLAGQLGMPA